MDRLRRILTSAVVIAIVSLIPASAAFASQPVARLTLPRQADAGVAIPYTFKTTHLPRHAGLAIQRQMGTARRFRTVATPRSGSGSGALRALPLGQYKIRLTIFSRRRIAGRIRDVLLATSQRLLLVFGNVPLGTLLGKPEQTATLQTRTFAYVLGGDVFPDGATPLQVDGKSNPCRSVHIDWATDPGSGEEGDVAKVSVLQESRDPVTAQANRGDISAVDSVVTPGQSWSITAATVGHGLTFYLDGSASCDSQSLVSTGWT